jgi:hypothetical protein
MNNESQLPESIIEEKEFCFSCGKILGMGSRGVKVTIEAMSTEKDSVMIETENSYFCDKCAKSGVCVNVKSLDKGV